ncbi:hypothetical protein [Pseudomonas azerbaijanoccidentalis]
MKKGIRVFRALLSLGMASAAFSVPASPASGFDWSTGQGLVDTCSRISIPQEKATQDDTALVLMCVVQFKTWRDSWSYADAYNEHVLKRRGPICIPELVTNKTVIDGFLNWAKHGMTLELKAQPSTASVYQFMFSTYRCK